LTLRSRQDANATRVEVQLTALAGQLGFARGPWFDVVPAVRELGDVAEVIGRARLGMC
jgi:hypothetical protein